MIVKTPNGDTLARGTCDDNPMNSAHFTLDTSDATWSTDDAANTDVPGVEYYINAD